MKWRGPKTKGWEKVRAALSLIFFEHDWMHCELRLPGCWGFNALGFSHFRKRRKLAPVELWDVILICNICHDKIENAPEDEKAHIHERVIEERGWEPKQFAAASSFDTQDPVAG